jgi:hypothetical protein
MKYGNPITFNSKDMANLRILKSRSKFKVKVRRFKINVPVEMHCHKEHTYEI